jgi:hypothetical protein
MRKEVKDRAGKYSSISKRCDAILIMKNNIIS